MPVHRDLPRRAVHVDGAGTGCRPRGGRADRLDHGGRRHAAPRASPMSYALVTTPLRGKPYCHTAGLTSPMLTRVYLTSPYPQGNFPAACLPPELRELLRMR